MTFKTPKQTFLFSPNMKTLTTHLLLIAFTGILLFPSCAKLPVDASLPGLQVNHPGDSATFAIIGDYGEDSKGEADVAAMVKGWNPDFIITVGDNNYPLGSAGTIVN